MMCFDTVSLSLWGKMENLNGFHFYYPSVIWRKLRPKGCHPMKYFFKFPPRPNNIVLLKQAICWVVCLASSVFNVGAQTANGVYQALLTACMAWLFKTKLTMWEKPASILPRLILELLYSFEFSRAGQATPGKPAEIKGEPIGVVKNLKYIGN